jgi:hypothetical protein
MIYIFAYVCVCVSYFTGLSYSFGLRRPISASKDFETYPGPNQYKPIYTFLSHGSNRKEQAGSHGASFGSGPKSFMNSMAFASIAGHVGFLNPPDPSGWPSPRREDRDDDYHASQNMFGSNSSNKKGKTFNFMDDDDDNSNDISFSNNRKLQNIKKYHQQTKMPIGSPIKTGPFQKRGLSAKTRKAYFTEKRLMDELKELRKFKLKETPTLSKFSENTTDVEYWAKRELSNSFAKDILAKIKKNPNYYN